MFVIAVTSLFVGVRFIIGIYTISPFPPFSFLCSPPKKSVCMEGNFLVFFFNYIFKFYYNKKKNTTYHFKGGGGRGKTRAGRGNKGGCLREVFIYWSTLWKLTFTITVTSTALARFIVGVLDNAASTCRCKLLNDRAPPNRSFNVCLHFTWGSCK